MKKVKRLFGEFQPAHYELFLAPDRDQLEFSGRVIIKGRKVGRPNFRLTLHQKGLKIKSAKITKHDKRSGDIQITIDRINTQKSFDELRLHASEHIYPGEYTIELEFSGKITEPMHGIYPCNFEVDGHKKQLIASQFESHHAREAFPCVDEPEAKATFDLTLVSPDGETVIANTPVKSQTKKGQLLETVFETTPKMSTYLLAFAYGELGYKSSKTKSGVEVRVYATKDKVELTDFAVDVGVRCLEFFEDYYGVPYPLPKLDLIGLPDFSAGAMENWGLVTFRESVLYVDPKSSSVETKQFVAMVICHELAHQWFGNLVTMKWWNDLWLNESFADLMEYRAVDELFPEWKIWDDFVFREIGSALGRDALPNVQPVQTEVNHPDELMSLFDPAIVYAKGGSLLNMVRHLIGEDNFRAGLKTYFEEFKYQNTVADDLWNHLKNASGTDIGSVMQNWLQQPGFPVIEVSYQPGEPVFSASQSRLIVGQKPKKDSTIWQVPLASSIDTDKPLLGSKKSDFKISASAKKPLVLNHLGRSYLAAQYLNPEHFDNIIDAAKTGSLDSIDRLVLVQSYVLLERALRVSTTDNLKLLGALSNDRSDTVWGLLAGIAGSVRGLIDKNDPLETKLDNYLAPLVKPLVKELGWQGKSTDSSQTQRLRSRIVAISLVAGDKDTVADGLKLFKKFNKPADLDADIRSNVYFAAIRYGTNADFEKLLALYKSLSSADEKDEVAAELTATRDSSNIQQLLKMITSKEVRLQDAPTWYAWLLRNRYATADAWQWLQDNWAWVEKNYGSDKSYDRFPRYSAMVYSKPLQLKAYKEFFEPKSNLSLERSIKLGIEEIEGRIGWRQRNEQPVKDWLASL